MPLVLAAALGLAGLLFVLYPLLGPERTARENGLATPPAEVADGERLARAALREVEFDHSLGNLEDDDYQALRARYERRALSALRLRYQRERELDDRIERELAELRAEATASPSAGPTMRTFTPTQPRAPRSPAPQGPRTRRGKGL